MLAKQYRLNKNYQYGYVYKKGASVSSRNLALIYVKAAGGFRIGFSVSNKIGKANVRNKVKRRLRESARLAMPHFSKGYNYVFAARIGIVDEAFDSIYNSVVYLLKKAGLFVSA